MKFPFCAGICLFACIVEISITFARADEIAPTACFAGYSIADLGAAATTFNISGTSGSLNDRGHIAGNVPGSNPQAEAAIYRNGTITLLGSLGGSFSYALGVNDSDKIVGYSYLSGNTAFHATKFHFERAPTDLGTLGGSTSVALAINRHGMIVGAANLAGDKQTHAARFTHDGAIDLGTLGGSGSVAVALNDEGDAIGNSELAGDIASHATLYPVGGGAPIDLGTLGGNTSAAYAINRYGVAVGYSTMPLGGPTHAAVYMSWAAPIDLGGAQSQAFGINDSGDIVGFATVGGQPHAALWVPAGGTWTLTDLNSLIDPTSGWTIDFAWAINDRGAVEASAHKSDVIEHTLLLTRCEHSQ